MRFKPALWPTIGFFLLALVFARLGAWQMHRADEKIRLIEDYSTAPAIALQDLDQANRFARLSFSAHFTDQHLLLDNQTLDGKPGIHVFTPAQTADGQLIMVNRGWLPLTNRNELPRIESNRQNLRLSGRINLPPKVGRRLGNAAQLATDQWPQLITYYEDGAISAALQQEISPWVVQLDPDSPGGVGPRRWQAVNFGPDKHYAYAVQWAALALTVLIVWVVLSRDRGKRRKD